MVILKNVDFRNVFGASGTRGFLGEGYWFHRLYCLFRGFDFEGSTFIAKTSTWTPEAGSLPLDDNFQPKERFPKCIRVYFRQGVALNAVAWSNPGLCALAETGKWQEIKRPFLVSLGVIGRNFLRRTSEAKSLAWYMREKLLPTLKVPIGVEVSVGCPNRDHADAGAARDNLLVMRTVLDTPLVLKVHFETPVGIIKQIQDDGLCDALSLVNAIHWGSLPDKIDWKKLFGTDTSPLEKFGGGSLSGWPLIDISLGRVKELRQAGITLPIIAGGGIGCRRSWRKDIDALKDAGADAISIGTAAIVRPWRMKSIIDYGGEVFPDKR